MLQRIADPPLAACTECGGPVHKVISSPSGLLFKGNGWYVTDYARKGEKKDGDAAPAAKAKGEEKSTSNGTSGSAPKEAAPKPKPTSPSE